MSVVDVVLESLIYISALMTNLLQLNLDFSSGPKTSMG